MTHTAFQVLLDGNIYDKLQADSEGRQRLTRAVESARVRVIITPVVIRELKRSPFGGVPNWFPVDEELENVSPLDHWPLGFAKLGDGNIYTQHRGSSKKVRDAALCDSADAYADALVTEDGRCRKRMAQVSSRCRAWTYEEFQSWLRRTDDRR